MSESLTTIFQQEREHLSQLQNPLLTRRGVTYPGNRDVRDAKGMRGYIRPVICRRNSKFYLTNDQRAFYRTHRRLIKQIDEPCQKIIPIFEYFIEYIMRDPYDVHWKPYSILCQFCLFKYNFIGKFETIEQDLRKIITYLGLKSNYWIKDSYFSTGKTKDNYKLLFSNLNETSICFLKYFYQNDFTLFDYHIEDYITENTNINCSSLYFKKIKHQ